MPRYLHIPHTLDTARTLTLSGRNCLVVSGIVTTPKIGYRRGKGRRGEMCPQGTQKSHSGAAACLVAYLCVHASHIALPACGAALAELGLTQIVTDLEQQNNEVIRLMDERAAERQQQKTIVLADDRRMADRAMKSCDRVLNALAILDDDPQRFSVLINALTADQTEWRQRYDDNRRANKRVSVKSDVVGRSTSGRLLPTGRKNHLYQTARDWTWARLIEDGKALLAIDPDQPTRILSTDKKAQKAGGLCLALKGVPVKPTDDVDVDKEYQLIPIDSL